MTLSVSAQDRLVPDTAGTLEGYDADVKCFLSDGTDLLWLVQPSMMSESSICWDSTTNELISTRAVSIIWSYNLYKDHRRRNPETEAPKLKKHRLRIPAETGGLIEGLLEDAVKTAVHPKNKMHVLDGTTYTFFSGDKSASHHYGAGEKVKELVRVTYVISQAVEHGSLDELNAIVPAIKALRAKFREPDPDDVPEGTTSKDGTLVDFR